MNYTQFKKDTKEFERRADELDKVKYACKCGHKVVIPKYVDKRICGWCGRWVFKCKQDEFKYRVNEKMKGVKL